jgi:autotransporter-associated beta strand protein
MSVNNSIGRNTSTASHFSTAKKKSVIALAAAAGLGLMAGSRMAPADTLLWTNGGADGLWNGTSLDWNDLTTSTNGVVYTDGSAVQFSDSGPGGGIVINAVTAAPPGVSPASVEFTHGTGAAGNYTFTDGTGTNGIEGAATLTMDAGYAGTVYLDAVNSYTGATNVNGGTLEVINNGNYSSAGSTTTFSSITLNSGTFAFNHTVTTFANPVILASGSTDTIMGEASGDNVSDTGTISSSAGATVSNTVLNFSGGNVYTFGWSTNTLAGLTGTVNVTAGTLRFNPYAVALAMGSPTALFNVTATLSEQNATGVTLLGGLEGSGTVAGAGHSGSNTNNYAEFVIGGAGVNTTYTGTITGGSERGMIEVTGGGSLTLSNGSNSYATKTGTAPAYQGAGTTILGNGQQPMAGTTTSFLSGASTASNGGGHLYVSNTTGSATGASPVYVEGASVAGGSGGLLGGDGIIQGEVSTIVNTVNNATDSATPLTGFAAGSIIAPGEAGSNTSETLTLSGGLQLGDWANLDFSLDTLAADADNALITVSKSTDASLGSALTLPSDGNINVNFSFPNGSPQQNVPYNLITYTGGISYGTGSSASLADWSSNASNAVFSDTGSAIQVTFVPEPASLGVLSLGALALLRRRRTMA